MTPFDATNKIQTRRGVESIKSTPFGWLKWVTLAVLLIVTLPACHPTCPKPTKPAHGWRPVCSKITAGSYRITIVTADGPKKGARASGELWLKNASPRDQSPKTGEKVDPRRGKMDEILYGSTEFEYEQVGGILNLDGTRAAPHPKSNDPIRPGVLIMCSSDSADMAVGTHINVRSTFLTVLDDIGLHFRITETEQTGFSGVFRYGYFCATRHNVDGKR